MALQERGGPGWGQSQWGTSPGWGQPQWTTGAPAGQTWTEWTSGGEPAAPTWTEHPPGPEMSWPSVSPYIPGSPSAPYEHSGGWTHSWTSPCTSSTSQPSAPPVTQSSTWPTTSSTSIQPPPSSSSSTSVSPPPPPQPTSSSTSTLVPPPPPPSPSTTCGTPVETFFSASWFGYRPNPTAPPLATYYTITDPANGLVSTSIYCDTDVFNTYIRTMVYDCVNNCPGPYQSLNADCEIVVGPLFTTTPCQSSGVFITQTGPSGNVVSLGTSIAGSCLTTTNAAGQTGIVDYTTTVLPSPATYTGDVITATAGSPRLMRRDYDTPVNMPDLTAKTSVKPFTAPNGVLSGNNEQTPLILAGANTAHVLSTSTVSSGGTVQSELGPTTSTPTSPATNPSTPTPTSPTPQQTTPTGGATTPTASPSVSQASSGATPAVSGSASGSNTQPAASSSAGASGASSAVSSNTVAPATGAAPKAGALSNSFGLDILMLVLAMVM